MHRNLSRTTIAATVLAVAAAVAPATATGAPTAKMTCASSSTTAKPNGWGNRFADEQGQAGTHSSTSVNGSDGSLDLTTTQATPRRASYHSAGQIRLQSILAHPLEFDKNGGNVNWQIRITGANTSADNGFATLVWTAAGDGHQVATNSDKWYATRDLPGYKRGAKATLKQLADAADSADHVTVVDDYGVSSQPAAPDLGAAYVDAVTFNGCTTHFTTATTSGSSNGSVGSIFPFW